MRKRWMQLGLILLIFVVAIQFVPVNRTNPAGGVEITAPQEVKTILKRSCYDCHSNQTVWPWYSRVAPVSWLVARDVEKGRKHVNFTTWDVYDLKKRMKILEELLEEVEEGEMPLGIYLPLHPEAKLSQNDIQALRKWVQYISGPLPLEKEEE